MVARISELLWRSSLFDITNTLHSHFIHHFAVKSAPVACAEVLAGVVMRVRRVTMKSTTGRRDGARAARMALLFVWIVAAVALPRPVFANELGIVLDQASLLKLPEKVSTIVVGNPAIADVAVQSGGLVVVTGKGYGTTNLIALDRAGVVLMERNIVVRGSNSSTVSVYRGVDRESYSCVPDCERRITLGDSPSYFGAVMGQTDARNNQATTAGAASKNGAR